MDSLSPKHRDPKPRDLDFFCSSPGTLGGGGTLASLRRQFTFPSTLLHRHPLDNFQNNGFQIDDPQTDNSQTTDSRIGKSQIDGFQVDDFRINSS